MKITSWFVPSQSFLPDSSCRCCCVVAVVVVAVIYPVAVFSTVRLHMCKLFTVNNNLVFHNTFIHKHCCD